MGILDSVLVSIGLIEPIETKEITLADLSKTCVLQDLTEYAAHHTYNPPDTMGFVEYGTDRFAWLDRFHNDERHIPSIISREPKVSTKGNTVTTDVVAAHLRDRPDEIYVKKFDELNVFDEDKSVLMLTEGKLYATGALTRSIWVPTGPDLFWEIFFEGRRVKDGTKFSSTTRRVHNSQFLSYTHYETSAVVNYWAPNRSNEAPFRSMVVSKGYIDKIERWDHAPFVSLFDQEYTETKIAFISEDGQDIEVQSLGPHVLDSKPRSFSFPDPQVPFDLKNVAYSEAGKAFALSFHPNDQGFGYSFYDENIARHLIVNGARIFGTNLVRAGDHYFHLIVGTDGNYVLRFDLSGGDPVCAKLNISSFGIIRPDLDGEGLLIGYDIDKRAYIKRVDFGDD